MSFWKPEPEERAVVEFWLKVLVAVGALWFGLGALDYFDAEQRVRASLAGSTALTIDGGVGTVFTGGDGREYCRITGRYEVTNIGDYGFYADEVVLRLWEVPHLDHEIEGDDDVVAFAISSRLCETESSEDCSVDERLRAKKLVEQHVPVGESFAPQNSLQRSFAFIFPIERYGDPDKYRFDSYYLIDANARAALEPSNGAEGEATASYCGEGVLGNLRARIGDPGVCFNENDLRHNSHTFYCTPLAGGKSGVPAQTQGVGASAP